MSNDKRKSFVEGYLFGGEGRFSANPSRTRRYMYESMYARILTEFATNRFVWSGLPDTIDSRFLELELFRAARVIFYYDNDYERFLCLRGAGFGKWNMYDNPIEFQVIGNTMVNKRLHAGAHWVDGVQFPAECVPIWANTMRLPDFDLVYLQSTKLGEIERTIEIALNGMRQPVMFAVDKNELLTFKNLWRQVSDGQPVIFGTETLGESLDNKVKLFDMGVDKDLLGKLQDAKHDIWSETMTFLGIDNANTDKRERLVTDEVTSNNGQIQSSRNSALGARKYAAKQINALFGLDVSVEWNEAAPVEPTALDNTGEGGSDGDVHNSAD